jgi:hypothetical protein
MSELTPKPLNWQPDPQVGYTVTRRADGGMLVTFTDTKPATLEHWRAFSLQHLLDSDRLTRNLYDLRQVQDLPPAAIQYAMEVANDPSVRNLWIAVVVANEKVRKEIEEIDVLTPPGGVEIGIFDTLEAAEAWLDRPLTLLV